MIAPNDCKAADSLMVEGMPLFFALAMAMSKGLVVSCVDPSFLRFWDHDENLRGTPPMPPPKK